MTTLISPNTLNRAARENMLNGREPETDRDWELIVNFWAANISDGAEESACKLLAMIYQCPLPTTDIQQIATFQAERK